jgi:hypothetical protein
VFGSQVLEVMIGLLLIYLALSVVCSGLKEVLASLFALRSKTLEVAIQKMLQDINGDVAQKRAAHPLRLGWSREAKGLRGTLLSWPESPLKLLGILVSSSAILLGAPFWFDLLNNFINLRMSGQPPAPSR